MLSVSLKSVGNGEKKDAGLEIGKAAAAAILALRADDAGGAGPGHLPARFFARPRALTHIPPGAPP